MSNTSEPSKRDDGGEVPLRGPRVFSADDGYSKPFGGAGDAGSDDHARRGTGGDARDDEAGPTSASDELGSFRLPTSADVERGFRWGSLFVSAVVALTLLALGVWFSRFISSALAATGFVGWLATSLLLLVCVAGVALIVREALGFWRLGRLETIKVNVNRAYDQKDGPKGATLERRAVREVTDLYAGRPELRDRLERFRANAGGIHDPGDLLKLLDRDVAGPLDIEARRVVLSSAKRISVVTAISPLFLIDVLFVFFENVRMLRAVATIYGGRPGFLGGLRLGRLVILNLIAAGGIALTDDLLGQFLGQDLLRRV
ncbi:MAG: TIGR01620 family protein, partial [Pseudomonadota bacterium]